MNTRVVAALPWNRGRVLTSGRKSVRGWAHAGTLGSLLLVSQLLAADPVMAETSVQDEHAGALTETSSAATLGWLLESTLRYVCPARGPAR